MKPYSLLVPAKSIVAFCAIAACAAFAAPALADTPAVGARGAIVADPTVPGLASTPCVVSLYSDTTFADFSAKDFDYDPPTGCPGPYAKIVLRADFSVTAGRQFDRTAILWIGGANLYYGTTQEPSAAVSPTWHVERDVTDYGVLFGAHHKGRVDLGNLVNATYTGVIHGSAQLVFYPEPAIWTDHPRRPDQILPLALNDGGTTDLTGTASLTRTFTLPTNIERVFMDVVAQSQGGDEFWYLCVPDEFATDLQSCSGTGFREGQVSIDGVPAGVVPVYPWIYTGGIDPGLWRPIPGVQALSFEPWRVDLTPFAGKLNDGHPHSVSLSVFNAQDHFSTAANLLLYLDAGKTVVTGGVDSNSLTAAPTPAVSHDHSTNGTVATTTIKVESQRDFTIAGHVDTSHGRVATTLHQKIDFSNLQQFSISDAKYLQHLVQGTTVASTTTRNADGIQVVLDDKRSFPLTIDYLYQTAPDESAVQTASVDQGLERDVGIGVTGYTARHAKLSNHQKSQSSLNFDATGTLISRSGQSASQRYTYADPFGACYDRQIDAAAGAVTAVTDGTSCPGKVNAVSGFDAFHNLASILFGANVLLLP